MNPGTYNLPQIRRGDSIPSQVMCTLTRTDTGAALSIASAKMQIRTKADVLVYEWSSVAGTMVISGVGGNVVTRNFVAGATTATWPPGAHVYDLELNLTTGETWTVLSGAAVVLPDITR